MTDHTHATPPFTIGIPIYKKVDLLDVSAPCEIFSWMADSMKATRRVEIITLAATKDKVQTRAGLHIVPDKTFAEQKHLDLLWVPGGDPEMLGVMMADTKFLDLLRGWAANATYVTSVCEGALLLAAAGLLDGYRATTHWAFIPCLRQYPKITVLGAESFYPRFVIDPPTATGKGIRVTGAGISSGIDEALALVQLIGGEDMAKSAQQMTQYYPQPPVHADLPTATSCPMPIPSARS